MTPNIIILDLGGPEFLPWWVLINIVMVVVALAIVHGLEAIGDRFKRRRRRR